MASRLRLQPAAGDTPGPVDQGSACGTSREWQTSPPPEAHEDQKGPPQTDGGTHTQRRGQPQNPTPNETKQPGAEGLLVCPPRPDSISWMTNCWSPSDSESDPFGTGGETLPRSHSLRTFVTPSANTTSSTLFRKLCYVKYATSWWARTRTPSTRDNHSTWRPSMIWPNR